MKGTSGPVVMVFSLLGETKTISSMPKTSPPSTSTAPIDGSTEVFTVVEQQPMFPGGVNAMFKFQYPEAAIKKRKQGKVFVSFVVNTDGSLSDLQILKGIRYGCDAEAIRVMKAMPNWIPGHQSGRPVAVKYNLPISFQLSEKKTGYVPATQPIQVGIRRFPKLGMPTIDASLNGPEPTYSFRVTNRNNAIGDGREPLYFINGKKADKDMMTALDPDSIESINVLKGNPAITKYENYGDLTWYGVVEITTKKAVKE